MCKGNDITIFTTGFILNNVFQAAKETEKEGISVRVINMHTIKPIDHKMILKCAAETAAILTVEEHSIIGGLGSAVAEVLAEEVEHFIPFVRIGMRDSFCDIHAEYDELQKEYGLCKESIISSIRKLHAQIKDRPNYKQHLLSY